jgi:hypothetical protein
VRRGARVVGSLPNVGPWSRVRLTLWLLVFVAVLATGLVSRALTWEGALAPVAAAMAGVLAAVAGLLALRILVVTARRRGVSSSYRHRP